MIKCNTCGERKFPDFFEPNPDGTRVAFPKCIQCKLNSAREEITRLKAKPQVVKEVWTDEQIGRLILTTLDPGKRGRAEYVGKPWPKCLAKLRRMKLMDLGKKAQCTYSFEFLAQMYFWLKTSRLSASQVARQMGLKDKEGKPNRNIVLGAAHRHFKGSKAQRFVGAWQPPPGVLVPLPSRRFRPKPTSRPSFGSYSSRRVRSTNAHQLDSRGGEAGPAGLEWQDALAPGPGGHVFLQDSDHTEYSDLRLEDI